MARDIDQVRRVLKSLEGKYAERDHRWQAVKSVRAGDLSSVFPDIFGNDYEYPMVANHLDTVARDLSEALAPLPALSCTNTKMTSDAARKAAQLKQRIGSHYWRASRLEQQMFSAGDNYVTYGLTVAMVEPDFEEMTPKFRFLHPMGCYPEFDKDGKTISLTRKWRAKQIDLMNQFPEAPPNAWGRSFYEDVSNRDIEVVRYIDKDQYLVFVKDNGVVLSRAANAMGKCPVVCGVRPSPDSEMRGQFDDILGVQAARAIMMRLAVEAAEKQVQAPIALPDDVNDITFGPDAVIRTAQPQNVHKVQTGVDGSTFQESAVLQQELLTGSRYPGARQGGIQANVITGRGVEALMGGFDSQIKSGQIVFASMLRELTELAFCVDETYWPAVPKTIRGVAEGATFEAKYVPMTAIKGDYTCDVTYGFLSGLDPNRALVFLLQLHGDKSIDRATLQRHMPFDIDLIQLQQNIEVEGLRDSLMEGIAAYVQALGPMVANGQDPTQPLTVVAQAIKSIQSGSSVEDALLGGFQAQQAAAQAAAQAQAQQQAAAGGGAPGGPPGPGGPGGGGGPVDNLPPGVQDSGLLSGVAPGQAGMAPGGRPSLEMLMASLGAGGKPALSAGVRRALPI